MKIRIITFGWSLIWLCACWALGSCAGQENKQPLVTVTIEPQRFFAEQIAGDRFAVHCVVPAGQSPESYDPTPRQMIQVGESAGYLQIGHIGFELAWMDNIRSNNPQLPIFDLSEGVSLIQSSEEEEEEEEVETHAEHHHHHHHGGIDPHIWNSIQGARTIARNTRNAFQQLDPDHAAEYEARYQQLLTQIDSTGREVDRLLLPLRGSAFIIYHPALTYLAAEYGLTQLCIEMEGKEPSPAQLKQLLDVAKSKQVKVVFVQQEFDQKNAELIARESGCRLVRINPLNPDWRSEMLTIAKALSDGKAD
ncbi:MAG: metal ABC transporter solute-binding protein, Zn/Mn family [Parabacteroides sp.]